MEIDMISTTDMRKKVVDMTIGELFELFTKVIRECKRQDDEKAEREYRKLNGTKVPQ
mgnify:CR=1 FL=1